MRMRGSVEQKIEREEADNTAEAGRSFANDLVRQDKDFVFSYGPKDKNHFKPFIIVIIIVFQKEFQRHCLSFMYITKCGSFSIPTALRNHFLDKKCHLLLQLLFVEPFIVCNSAHYFPLRMVLGAKNTWFIIKTMYLQVFHDNTKVGKELVLVGGKKMNKQASL